MKRINIQKCQTFYFKTSIDNEEGINIQKCQNANILF